MQTLTQSTVAGAWSPAYHLNRVSDPAAFQWLDSLNVADATHPLQVAKCFGMDVAYLRMDMLYWFPNEFVLSIPFLDAPPPEYFFVTNEAGKRWWCFVVIRKNAEKATALVIDVSPSVLIVPLMGLRELDINPDTEQVTVGRDYPLTPRPGVLCPMDSRRIRHEVLSPETGEYLCIEEDDSNAASPNQVPTLSDVLGLQPNRPQTAPMRVSLGSPAFGLPLRINDDLGLMNLVASLGGSSGGPL